MKKRETISPQEAKTWNYRRQGTRPMTDWEAQAWDMAREEGDRDALLRIKRACSGEDQFMAEHDSAARDVAEWNRRRKNNYSVRPGSQYPQTNNYSVRPGSQYPQT